MRAYYNDNEPFVCEWTRNLIAAGHITPGTVDERSVTELTAADLAGHERVHLFSGLAGWEAALNLAGWHGPVWSASLPCPAFSCAGKSGGFADPRGQLWLPVLRLIRECCPECVVGEQVPAAIRHGWLDRIFTDLEAAGYACGACVLGAHSSGAPHRRQRIFWVAVAAGTQRHGSVGNGDSTGRRGPSNNGADDSMADAQHAERRSDLRGHGRERSDCGWQEAHGELGTCGEVRDVGESSWDGCQVRQQLHSEHDGQGLGEGCDPDKLANAPQRGQRADQPAPGQPGHAQQCGQDSVDNASSPRRNAPQQGPEGEARHDARLCGPERGRTGDELGDTDDPRPQGRRIDAGEHAREQSAWAASKFIPCADGKARRVPLEPAFQPLVDARDGARNRVGILRAAGNSICVPTAATFLRAVMAL